MYDKTDIKYMKLALKLARKAKDKTYPNPMVGAVIVRDGKVLAKAYHPRAGESHAEVRAIMSCRRSCRGGTMYVTLEPCDHYGKTPPCTEAIISEGIKEVKLAMKDPNPINNGRGIKRLQAAGISVSVGLCEEEAARLNEKYVKFVQRSLPYVTVKLAQSLDGKIAARDGTSKWISSKPSREYAKKMRSDFNAVVVGANTVCQDDPLLFGGKEGRPQPVRVVADTRLKIPIESKIVKTAAFSPVIIGTTELAPARRVKEFKKQKGVELVFTRSKRGKVALKSFLKKLARKDIVNILVEGGGEFVGALMDESLVDEVMFFISPRIIGGGFSSIKGAGAANIKDSLELYEVKARKIGGDLLVKGRLAQDVGHL